MVSHCFGCGVFRQQIEGFSCSDGVGCGMGLACFKDSVAQNENSLRVSRQLRVITVPELSIARKTSCQMKGVAFQVLALTGVGVQNKLSPGNTPQLV